MRLRACRVLRTLQHQVQAVVCLALSSLQLPATHAIRYISQQEGLGYLHGDDVHHSRAPPPLHETLRRQHVGAGEESWSGNDTHPLISIQVFPPVYDFDQSGRLSLAVQVLVRGCLVGVQYRAIVEETTHPQDSRSWFCNQPWEHNFSVASGTDSLHFQAVFSNPAAGTQFAQRHRFRVQVTGVFESLPEQEMGLAALDKTFSARKLASTGVEIRAAARNAQVFDRVRSREYAALPEGPAVEMARACGEHPLGYLQSIFDPAQSESNSSCIITGFDQSHEEEGMLMILQMVLPATRHACWCTIWACRNMRVQYCLPNSALKSTTHQLRCPTLRSDSKGEARHSSPS